MAISFSPNSIALVGASSDPDRISGLPQAYLQRHGYDGVIYPVNPNHESIRGVPCYPTVDAIPETPDLAMIMLPASMVVEMVTACLSTGVKDVIIVSSGFSETGSKDGRCAENRLRELADEYDANVVGPNSQGMINFHERAIACFTPALSRDELEAGPVSFVTQSGAFGGALTTLFQDRGIGLNKWISTGNEAALGALDFIEDMVDDNTTDIAVGYLEGFNDPRKLLEINKTDSGIDFPIVVLKVGRSERGKRAAASHTGKIAGEAAIYESVLRENGVITVDDIDLLSHVTETLLTMNALPGRNLGILSTSGGAGVYLADLAADLGLNVPELTSETQVQIESHLPEYGSALNPIDTTAAVLNSQETFDSCLNALFVDENVDTVLLQITNIDGDHASRLAETVRAAKSRYEKPIVVCWTGGIAKESALEIFADADVPVFENPARCLETIEAIQVYRWAREPLRAAKNLPAYPPTPEQIDKPVRMTEVESKQLLAEYGIDVPDEQRVTDTASAIDAVETIGYPIVGKLVSPDVEHRNHVGGIRLDLRNACEVERATEELLALADELDADDASVLIQRQIGFEEELSLGIVDDDDFGPVVMLGRGGVDIEDIDDVAFRTIPTVSEQARTMIDELETVSANQFTRKQLESIVEAVTAISELYIENPWIDEADVNPIVTTDDGIIAVDALFSGGRSEE